MTKKQTFLDPFAVLKSMYENTETKWNEVIHETMLKEAYSEWIDQYFAIPGIDSNYN